MNKTEHGFVKRVLPVLIAGALSGTVSLAHAQGAVLEEVIVTAQKRSENLQDVPISVQALDSRALEKTGIVSLSDIRAHVPGMTIDSYPGSSEMLYPSIRGIVPNSVQTSVPIPMAIHLDGVALTQLAGLNLAGADLERIEVLKGPQGVLAGRNATGGAINIVTAKPELGRFGFKQQVTVAERGQWLSKTVVNVPLGENFAAKVSYLHSERDNLGIRNSAPNGPQLGEKTSDSWRLDLRWKAANNVMVDYGYDRAETESIDVPQQCMVPWLSDALPFLATVDGRVSSMTNGCSLGKLTSLNVPFQIPKNRNIAEGHNLTVNWEVDPSLTFRSITGYRKVDTQNTVLYTGFGNSGNPYYIRSDSAPANFTTSVAPFDGQNHPWIHYNESWSQEFQLLGDVSPNFKYTTGIYFATEKGHQSQGPAIHQTTPDAGLIIPQLSALNLPVGVDMLALEQRALSARNSTWAVFGQFSWRPDILSRKLEIVPGVRYTRDHREAVGSNQRGAMYFVTTNPTTGVYSLIPFPPPFPNPIPNSLAYTNAPGDLSFSKTTPTVSLNYHWDDNLMTYLKVAKGYVTGGFDDQQPSAAGFSKGFAPETITSYELGLKGEFFNRRLRVNGAVFNSEYKNEQKSTAHAGSVWAIENVGTSKYNGAELDITAQVTDGFRVSGSVTWLDHKYARWIDQDTSSATYGKDVANIRKLVVPKVSYSINLDYRFPNLGLPGKLDASLNFAHKDAQSTPIDTSFPGLAENVTTPKYDVVNGRLSLSQIKVGPGGDLTVALWGKNLSDKKYQGFTLLNSSAYRVTNWSEPRTYGVDVIYNY